MKRTISVEIGKGSVNHNSRKFKAENVDGARSHLNIDYCNERIQDVYQLLFGTAQERFNARPTGAFRTTMKKSVPGIRKNLFMRSSFKSATRTI